MDKENHSGGVTLWGSLKQREPYLISDNAEGKTFLYKGKKNLKGVLLAGR